MEDPLEDGLRSLAGVQVSSIVFVRDYLQIVFDPSGSASRLSATPYPTLTCRVWPVVCVGEDRLAFGDEGYRDALCERIDVALSGASVSEEEVVLTFEDSACLILSLPPGDPVGPEALTFSHDDGRWWTA